jgi:hypothetical protein
VRVPPGAGPARLLGCDCRSPAPAAAQTSPHVGLALARRDNDDGVQVRVPTAGRPVRDFVAPEGAGHPEPPGIQPAQLTPGAAQPLQRVLQRFVGQGPLGQGDQDDGLGLAAGLQVRDHGARRVAVALGPLGCADWAEVAPPARQGRRGRHQSAAGEPQVD